MNLEPRTFGIVVVIGLIGLVAGCPFIQPPGDLCADVTCDEGLTCDANTGRCVAADPCEGVVCTNGATCVDGACVPGEPPEFQDASAARGGGLYDKWWVVAGVDAPVDDHPFWATQDTNTRSGADTWRCKECHGWDYKGVDGVYGSGGHMTGFAGVFGTTLSAQEVFDLIKTDHGYGAAGLSDDHIWDLAKFVLEGQIDTDEIIDAGGAFTGDAATGQTLYDDGIGTNTACTVCHGPNGTLLPFDEGTVTLGGLADGNPWEVQHKIRFGQPGTAMQGAFDVNATNDDVADVGAYCQALPTGSECTTDIDCPEGETCQDGECVVGDLCEGVTCAVCEGCVDGVCDPLEGDAAAGEVYYADNGCAACHAADGSGGFGPSLIGEECAEFFNRLSGVESHPGGTVDGVTEQDAADLAAWLAGM